MEKNFYLNQSNCKWITIGIQPATKLINKDYTGFYVDVAICGKSMKPMSLGGIDGFMNLCQSLRSFEELKFTYPMAAANYSEISTPFPMNISKKPWNGMMCFHIETINGDKASMAQNSCAELLKYENFIVFSIKKMESIVNDIESKFNDIIHKGAKDYSTTVKEIEKTMDTFAADIFTNFNDLLKMCIDQVNRFNVNPSAPSKRKRTTPVAGKRAKAKKNDVDHSYADTADTVEIDGEIPNEVESDESAPASELANESTENEPLPLGLIESGQRVESEVYL